MITLNDFMIVSVVLFCVGLFIIVSKKNAIQILIGIELMLERRYFKPGSFWQI
jgi:NADH:ubiquinone oxidoreductase subunit K